MHICENAKGDIDDLISIKVFPENLMVDMASKNISSCTVSYTPLPMKTDLHFQQTLP